MENVHSILEFINWQTPPPPPPPEEDLDQSCDFMEKLQYHILNSGNDSANHKYFLQESHRALTEQGRIIRRSNALLRTKDSVIRSKDKALDDSWQKLDEMELKLREKDAIISNLKRTIRERKK